MVTGAHIPADRGQDLCTDFDMDMDHRIVEAPKEVVMTGTRRSNYPAHTVRRTARQTRPQSLHSPDVVQRR